VVDAVSGFGGRDSRAWAARVQSSVGGKYTPAVRVPAVGPAAGNGPTTHGALATAAYLAVAEHGELGAKFGRRCMQPYIRLCANDRTVPARLFVRTGSIYTAAGGAPRGQVSGLLWGSATCPACPATADAASPTLDAWHRVAECPAFAAMRAEALQAAAAKVRAHADGVAEALVAAQGTTQAVARVPKTAFPPLRDGAVKLAQAFEAVAAADPNSADVRNFVFLAAMGQSWHGKGNLLPAAWAACLAAPTPGATNAQQELSSVAVNITFSAFAALARAAFAPLVPPAAGALPPVVPPQAAALGGGGAAPEVDGEVEPAAAGVVA
jgi:hypothetical protein